MTATGNFLVSLDGLAPMGADRTEVADSALTEVKAYLRSYDGDYLLSALEEQAFLSARSAPMADRLPVSDATLEDPDADLVDAFVASIRKAVGGSPTAASRCAAAGSYTPTGVPPWRVS